MELNLSIVKLLRNASGYLLSAFRLSRKRRLERIDLLRTLINANSCCSRCGILYGEPRDGVSTSMRGVCSICNRSALLKDTRHYAYLRKGIKKLSDH
jgi:hypothetical protein